jgi:flagellar protein FlbB
MEKKSTKFKVYLFAFFIPLFIVVALMTAISWVWNINITEKAIEWGEQLPVISSIVETDGDSDRPESDASNDLLEEEVNADKDAQKQLEQALIEKEDEITQLQDEIVKLNQQLEEEKEAEDETTDDIKSVAKVYEEMSAKDAAAIIAELGNENALVIINNMKLDAQAAILSEMDPVQAAELTNLRTSSQ